MAYSKGYDTQWATNGTRFMLKALSPLMAAAALVTATVPGDARPKEQEQSSALEARQQGRILPLREIEARVRTKMGDADYLGPELLDPRSGTYRLKFLRRERVIWIDVDGRTGQEVGRSAGK